MAVIDQNITSGEGVPDVYLVFRWPRAGSNTFAIRRPCYPPNLTGMFRVDKGRDIMENIPDMHRMILPSIGIRITTGRSNIVPIGRPGDAQYLTSMTAIDMGRLPRASIPDPDGL